MNRKKHCTLFAFPLIVILPVVSTISCSKSNDNKNDFIDIGDENLDLDDKPNYDDNDSIIDINDIKLDIRWIKAFRNDKTIYSNSIENYIFDNGDELLNNDEFNIQYVGINEYLPTYSIYDKKIKKYYQTSIDCKYQKFIDNFTKTQTKHYISTKIIENYKNEMIVEHNVSDRNFFIPVDTSDNSISFIKNEYVWFETLWGSNKNGTKESIFNLNISSTKIREMLFGAFEQNMDNLFIKNIKATDLYLLPKTIVLDDPVNYVNFWIENLKNNENEKYYSLTKDEKTKVSLDIPNRNNVKSQKWSGVICGKGISGDIPWTNYPNGISLSMLSMLNSNSKDYDNIISRINASNSSSAKNYFNEIINKGKRISINIVKEFKNNVNDIISLDFFTKINAGASSGSFAADGTHVGLYNISGIQKMSLTYLEYKKF